MTRFCAKISPTNESGQNAGSLADTPLVDKRATLSTIATTNKKNTRAKRTIHAQNMRTCSFLTFYICLLYSSYLSLHRFFGAERVSPQSRLHEYFDVNANAKNRISHYRELYAPKVYLQGKYKPYFGPQSFYRLLIFR